MSTQGFNKNGGKSYEPTRPMFETAQKEKLSQPNNEELPYVANSPTEYYGKN